MLQCLQTFFKSSDTLSILIVAGHTADRWVVRGIAIAGMPHPRCFMLPVHRLSCSNRIRHLPPWFGPTVGRVVYECKFIIIFDGCSLTCPIGPERLQDSYSLLHCHRWYGVYNYLEDLSV